MAARTLESADDLASRVTALGVFLERDATILQARALIEADRKAVALAVLDAVYDATPGDNRISSLYAEMVELRRRIESGEWKP